MKILKRLGNNKVKNKINRNWFDSFYILEYYKTNKCIEEKSSLGIYLQRARYGEN